MDWVDQRERDPLEDRRDVQWGSDQCDWKETSDACGTKIIEESGSIGCIRLNKEVHREC